MFLFEGDFGRILHTGDFRCVMQTGNKYRQARVLMRNGNVHISSMCMQRIAMTVPGGSQITRQSTDGITSSLKPQSTCCTWTIPIVIQGASPVACSCYVLLSTVQCRPHFWLT